MSYETPPIMSSELPASGVSTLSIYPEKISSRGDKKVGTKDEQIIGATAMTLISEVKTRYNNTVKAIDDFKSYSSSTEGRVKFGVMFAGLVGGCFLAYRSRSKYLWYKRMLPVSTLTIAASACYPYKAWEVAKTTSNGLATSYNVSKIAVSYCYEKLQKLKSNEDINAVHVPIPAMNEDELVSYFICL